MIDFSEGTPGRPVHHGASTWRDGDAIPFWDCLAPYGFRFYDVGDPVNSDPARVTCPGCLEELAKKTEQLLKDALPTRKT